MSREFKPGDVALIEAGCWANRVVALRVGVPGNMGWAYAGTDSDGRSTSCWSSDDSGVASVVRPLLVVDPEDPEQVQHLFDALGVGEPNAYYPNAAAFAEALRSLLVPEPEEPTGLGAVVEDGDGNLWTRVRRDDSAPWHCSTRSNWSRWNGIPRPLTVHSEGWTA